MKIPNLSKISHSSVEKSARRFITDLGVGSALLPVILLETSVTGGRTYHAYKRGGFVEARERGTEETLGAIFWLGGVQAFNKIGDKIGEKVLGFKDINFEVGKDAVRNPLQNYLRKHSNYSKKALATFKFTKIISSIILANAVIGFVVPKINQAITRRYQSSVQNLNGKNPNLKKSGENFDEFTKKINDQKTNNTSFKGNYIQTLLTLTNDFENDARYKLLSTDAGIAGGRAINARNKHERREILFRDLSSIYFYLLCRGNINSILNFIEDGKSTRLDPVSTKILDDHINKHLTKKSYTQEEFERLVLGDPDAKIPKNIQEKAQKNQIFKLNELEDLLDPETFKRAQSMSRLQPKLEGVSILTREQLQDVYSQGLINDPKFLRKLFVRYTKTKITNPLKFIADKDLRTLKHTMEEYIQNILKSAKANGENITLETLKKANKSNLIKNAFNLSAGFAVSAYFLSTVIPKVQYWITKRETGEDKFPGIQKYNK